MGDLLHHNSGIVIPRAEFEALADAMATILRIGYQFCPTLIERLDAVDGDADYEQDDHPEEDDDSGVYDEDGVNTLHGLALRWAEGPGCPIADPGGAGTSSRASPVWGA
jgi:hypothetical protein